MAVVSFELLVPTGKVVLQPVQRQRVGEIAAQELAMEVRPLRLNFMISFSLGQHFVKLLGWPGTNCSSSGSSTSDGVVISSTTSRICYFSTSLNRSKRSLAPHGRARKAKARFR